MRNEPSPPIRITELETLEQVRANGRSLHNCTLQAIDFSGTAIEWQNWHIENTTFLGCRMSMEEEILLRKKGAYIYRAPEDLPYHPFRKTLYTWQELMQGFSREQDRSLDWKIYRHFSASKHHPNINEALWQRIHDYSIDDALGDLLHLSPEGIPDKKCVGIMGGHSMGRDNPFYLKTAQTAKLLAENGYFIASGGGPGIMEAANLGAYFAGKQDTDLLQAVDRLKTAPHYTSNGYHQQALDVLDLYPEGNKSLAIPTWFYGHEPSNLFSSHIAKYFSNSIREDTLLAICLHGIIFAPGSAGTTQEIFMDAAQNHYGTFQFFSPMVFLGRYRYEKETSLFPLLQQLSRDKEYHQLLYLTDDPQAILEFILQHPPIRKE